MLIAKKGYKVRSTAWHHVKFSEKKEADDKLAAEKAEADRVAAEKKATEDAEAKRKEDEEKAKGENGQPKEKQLTEAQKKALQVEAELASLFNSGKKALTLEEVKLSAPACYSDIFKGYKDGEENGVGTSHYKLTEKEKEKFELTKLGQ